MSSQTGLSPTPPIGDESPLGNANSNVLPSPIPNGSDPVEEFNENENRRVELVGDGGDDDLNEYDLESDKGKGLREGEDSWLDFNEELKYDIERTVNERERQAGGGEGTEKVIDEADVQRVQQKAKQYAHKELAKQSKGKGAQYKVLPDEYWKSRSITPLISSSHWAYRESIFCFCLAVSAVIGGVYDSWSATIALAGPSSAILSISFVGIGYICLCFCLAEMSSAFPFSGGSYGYARALLGSLPGQLIGLTESLQWMMIAITEILPVAAACTVLFQTDPKYEGIWLALLYGISLFLNIMRGWWLYGALLITTFFSILFCLVFQFGMMRYGSWDNSYFSAGLLDTDGVTPLTNDQFTGGFPLWIQSLPLMISVLMGFEVTPLSADDLAVPRKSVSGGLIPGVLVTVIVVVFTIVAAISAPQSSYGTFSSTIFPLTDGFSLIFDNPDPRRSIWLVILCQWAAHLASTFGWGRQMYALARSNNVPHFLSFVWKKTGAPVAALVVGAIISFSSAISVRFGSAQTLQQGNQVLFVMAIILVCLNYCFMSVAFILLRVKFNSVSRPYRSPLGIPGAVICFIVFFTSLIGMLVYQNLVQWAVVAVFSWVTIGMLYYLLIARNHLWLSPEEYRSLFILYSIQFIRKKENLLKHTVDAQLENKEKNLINAANSKHNHNQSSQVDNATSGKFSQKSNKVTPLDISTQ